jgi:hypothetical protein
MEHNKNSESPPGASTPATGTGLFYKDGREIPPTHPDHGPMHLIPRQEDGSIAAYYYCSKAELYDAQVPAPPPRRQRRDGFTPERQAQFLDYVRGGASGREAARMVGISHTTAYNLHNSPDGAAFARAWDEAARVTDIVLEDTGYDRAVNGQEEVVYYKGERVGTRVKYDNNLLMKLLRARLPLKYAPLSEIEGWLRHRGIAPPADVDGALDRLREAEAGWSSRLPGEEKPARLPDQTAAAPTVHPERVEGPSCRSGQEDEDGPSTDPGRTNQESEDASVPSMSSTSPGTVPTENPAAASTSSTSPGTGQQEDPAAASTSSTSSETGQQEDLAAASTSSTSSTSSGTGQEAADSAMSSASTGIEPEAPSADRGAKPPDPDDGSLLYYRPPPRPRLTSL